jgi:hypothetical protein
VKFTLIPAGGNYHLPTIDQRIAIDSSSIEGQFYGLSDFFRADSQSSDQRKFLNVRQMFAFPEEYTIHQIAREAIRENAHMNLTCMEGLKTNATKVANVKRDRLALITQQVNLDAVDMMIAEENATQGDRTQAPFSFRLVGDDADHRDKRSSFGPWKGHSQHAGRQTMRPN